MAKTYTLDEIEAELVEKNRIASKSPGIAELYANQTEGSWHEVMMDSIQRDEARFVVGTARSNGKPDVRFLFDLIDEILVEVKPMEEKVSGVWLRSPEVETRNHMQGGYLMGMPYEHSIYWRLNPLAEHQATLAEHIDPTVRSSDLLKRHILDEGEKLSVQRLESPQSRSARGRKRRKA